MLESQGYLATLDLLDTKVSREYVAARDLREPLARQDPRDLRVSLDHRVRRETAVQPEWLEHRDRLVQLDTSDLPDHRELLVRQETPDSLDSKDLMAQMDSRACLEQLEQPAQQDLSATTDRTVLQVERAQLVWLETQAMPVPMDRRAHVEAPEFPDR